MQLLLEVLEVSSSVHMDHKSYIQWQGWKRRVILMALVTFTLSVWNDRRSKSKQTGFNTFFHSYLSRAPSPVQHPPPLFSNRLLSNEEKENQHQVEHQHIQYPLENVVSRFYLVKQISEKTDHETFNFTRNIFLSPAAICNNIFPSL